jgi:hypothetical protein
VHRLVLRVANAGEQSTRSRTPAGWIEAEVARRESAN